MKLKRIVSCLAAAALACCLAAPVYADPVTPPAQSSTTQNPDPTPAPNYNVDIPTSKEVIQQGDVYVTAYTVTDPAGGEIATVNWGDRVNIVVQVVDHSSARYDVDANEIVARINSSVFTYTGIGEVGQLYDFNDDPDVERLKAVREGRATPEQIAANKPYNYYTYVLLFRDVIYNGGGNTLPINLSYLDTSKPMQQFEVTIGQCKDEDPNDPSKINSPNLMVRESSFGDAAVTTGTAFPLSLGVYATKGTEALNDVVVSLSLPEGLTLNGGNLSFYVGSMKAGEMRNVTFSVLPSAAFVDGVASITVNLAGTGAVSGKAVSGSTTVAVPITQQDRFEIGRLEVPDALYYGDVASVTLSYVNKGKNVVSNLEARLTGENVGAGGYQYLGNLNPGTEGSVDFDLMPDGPGPVKGTLTLVYEGPDGAEHTYTEEFTTMVEEMPIYDDYPMDDMPIEEPSAGLPVWAYVLIVAGVAAVVVVVVVVVRRRKKSKKLQDLLDEESDEDL